MSLFMFAISLWSHLNEFIVFIPTKEEEGGPIFPFNWLTSCIYTLPTHSAVHVQSILTLCASATDDDDDINRRLPAARAPFQLPPTELLSVQMFVTEFIHATDMSNAE